MDLGDADLQPLRVLGQGTYGRVFLCKYRNSKKVPDVCVKRIIVQNPKADMKMIMEEIYIISQLKHPHIVQFIRSFVHAGTVNIVMEYASNGTVRDIITRARQCSTAIQKSHLLRYFCDILMGLEYIHIRHVFHRDLKPENLLVSGQGRIKISDFGISAIYTPGKQFVGVCGTPFYMAPEIQRGEKFDFKSDIWSLGCVLYEMCNGKNPFQQAKNWNDLLYLTRLFTRPKLDCQDIASKYGDVWGRLCEKMLLYDPQKRISLPAIVCLDPTITIPYCLQYFDYKY